MSDLEYTETEIETLTEQINDILTNSSRMKVEGKDNFVRHLGELDRMEASRQDILVQVGNIEPLPPASTGPVELVYQGDNYYTNDYSLTQYLGASPAGLRRTEFETFRGQDLPTFNMDGQPVEGSNFAHNYLMHVPASRPKLERYFRVEQDEIKGFVGKNYPLWWSDAQAIRSIVRQANQEYSEVRYHEPTFSRIGTVMFTLSTPDRKFNLLHRGERDNMEMGLYYRRNPFGGGSMDNGGYAWRQVCENGMMGWAPATEHPYQSITHHSESHFNSELGSFIEHFISDIVEEEPLYLNVVNQLKEGNRPGSRLETDSVYDLYGRTVLRSTEIIYDFMEKALEGATDVHIDNYKDEILAQAEKYSMVRKQKLLVQIAEQDPTIDTDDFTKWDLANVFTRYANTPEMDGDRKAELQQLGFNVLMADPITVTA